MSRLAAGMGRPAPGRPLIRSARTPRAPRVAPGTTRSGVVRVPLGVMGRSRNAPLVTVDYLRADRFRAAGFDIFAAASDGHARYLLPTYVSGATLSGRAPPGGGPVAAASPRPYASTSTALRASNPRSRHRYSTSARPVTASGVLVDQNDRKTIGGSARADLRRRRRSRGGRRPPWRARGRCRCRRPSRRRRPSAGRRRRPACRTAAGRSPALRGRPRRR